MDFPVWWVEYHPPQIHVHPDTQNVTLLGNNVFVDVIKDLKMKLSWV